jgi:hypothetical protein
MATGMVFVYLVIAALLAPVVWLAWWGASAFGDTARLRTVPAAGRRPAKARPVYSIPQAADMSLPRHPWAIAVCRPSDGAEIRICNGPDGAGRCPHANADGTVPCAGLLISLPEQIRGSNEWHIPAGYESCLAGSYATFRQG